MNPRNTARTWSDYILRVSVTQICEETVTVVLRDDTTNLVVTRMTATSLSLGKHSYHSEMHLVCVHKCLADADALAADWLN